jgi:hypothetical protein
MKITIIGKRNQLGTNPIIRLKGMSRLTYIFEWDPEIKAYAYEPKDQKEADDIFTSAGRLYKTMRFSVNLAETQAETPAETQAAPVRRLEWVEGFEEVDEKSDLLKRCRKLGLEVIPQDRPSSLKRLLAAFRYGLSYT